MIKEFQGEYRWLSNFAPCKIFYEGLVYGSVENAYQATKTLDETERLRLSTMTSGEAKRYSRTLTVRSDWDDIKLNVMRDLSCIKYSKEPYLSKLVGTGDSHIQEGNRWGDKFWGVCLKTGEGQNNLGLLLMDIRDKINKIQGKS